MLTTFDRLLRVAGVVALALVAGVFLFGTLRDRGQEQTTRDVACAVATWNGEIVDYFDGARARFEQRIGTPEEVSTDQESYRQLTVLLDASTTLARDIGRSCGPIIPRGDAR
ncbi:hypothetical protein [Miltoncostaea oceani]|uniref:hypothetical protein n=1 Tax=Miltoncostaea oceani TaxID=2843216 RepID=UPI001C3CB4AC|nr:hypothetical protein [Miltoncostaea oceani]